MSRAMAEFVDVMKKHKEMCDSYASGCKGCPLEMLKNENNTICSTFMKNCPEKAEQAIMAWEKPIDWSKVPIDTKILVKLQGDNYWDNRHFAKFENGKVYAWVNGTTSFTANGELTEWDFAKLAEEGEQDG